MSRALTCIADRIETKEMREGCEYNNNETEMSVIERKERMISSSHEEYVELETKSMKEIETMFKTKRDTDLNTPPNPYEYSS